ncbi:MAG TPA: M43 family zinc metalloprotease [Cytophagales bacterium]|nr:M43 family zinc metalloprotease [Cytophagales bacterium]
MAQSPVEHCATMEQDSINRVLYPQLGELSDFERVLQQKIREIEKRKKSSRTADEILTIPVVVHVIHKGESVGSGSNISLAQIQSQLEVLNEDFRKKVGTNGENSSSVGADIELEFCLAILDEEGKTLSEPGVHRYNGNKDKWTRSEIEGVLKPATVWDPDKYYNIWTLDFGGEDDRLLGYAQFPSQTSLPGLPANGGPASTDGVVVSYRHFGSSEKGNFPVLQAPYNKGRTLTHETGHYLGLRHIWGDGGCGADDFVSDTPDSDRESRGCEKGRTSCGVVNMVENYMDYSDDGCMNIFTRGQKTRIRAVMEISPRRNTLAFSNLCSPNVAASPEANFRADADTVLRGSTVSFTDLSLNFPDELKWTFEGAVPATSTQKNPRIVYSDSGSYSVSLIAVNELGSDTLVREDFIYVSPQGVCSDTTNFFGTPTLLPVPVEGETGYLSGHNSLKHRAKAEYFDNKLGYKYINRAKLKFAKALASKEDATVKVTVWNARGPQGSPGAILEEAEVLINRISADIENDQYTEVIFSRLTPVFGRGFYVGIQLSYDGDTVAITTTKDGEALISTAWQQNDSLEWEPYTIEYGINVAHDIRPVLGMFPSVQISTSDLYIQPGEKVTMNAKGASVFSWNSSDGTVSNHLGPQLIVYPYQTTTYTLNGSGMELCDSTASLTIYVNAPTGSNEDLNEKVKVYPNPTNSKVQFEINNEWIGNVNLELINSFGQNIERKSITKNKREISDEIDFSAFGPGLYILQFKKNDEIIRKKVIVVK